VISGNTITGSDYGIRLKELRIYYSGGLIYYSTNNTITRNDIIGNGVGIALSKASNNFIYLNNFIDNEVDAVLSEGYMNIWHSPRKLTYIYNGNTYVNYLGNYWSKYQGEDSNEDGIGDEPYVIDENNEDDYPLIESSQNYST